MNFLEKRIMEKDQVAAPLPKPCVYTGMYTGISNVWLTNIQNCCMTLALILYKIRRYVFGKIESEILATYPKWVYLTINPPLWTTVSPPLP